MEDTLHKLLMHILNTLGPRREPCGIPHLNVHCSELMSFICTNFLMLLHK